MWKIVIVDDEDRIARGLERIIEKIGTQYHVLQKFTKSEDALSFLQQNSGEVDLLITDISMPNMSGLELVECLRKQHINIPCIILTGYSEFAYAKKAISLGVISYLLKPVDVDELKQALARLILPQTEQVQQTVQVDTVPSREVAYIKQKIETQYQTFDMNQIANELGLSKEYLYRLFKKQLTISVSDYLLEVRMHQAKKYLSSVEKRKVYEVCQLVGYDDQIYFSKLFKKKFGIMPKEFQKHGLDSNPKEK